MQMNPAQLEMSRHHSGPLLVVSVAGSGKTTGVIENLKNKFEIGMDLRRVFVTAFNKDAAEQLKKKTFNFCEYANECSIGTSHSLFLKIQRAAGLRYKRLYPEWEIKKALNEILKPRYQNGEEFSVYRAISVMKNALATPMPIKDTDCYDIYLSIRDQFANECEISASELDRCFISYEENKRRLEAIDMDDMLLGAYIMFKQNKERLERLQEYYQHLIVDEYQDINECQHELFQMLSMPQNNIIAVGDDDQSIYAFRGASPHYIREFENHYPNAKIIHMSNNYRSQKLVLDLANGLIKNNSERYEKTMIHTISPDVKPYVLIAQDNEHEAKILADKIRNYASQGGLYSDVAILMRVNMQQPLIEIAMMEADIPYRVPDGASFFLKSEIVTILSYLKLAINPTDINLIRELANRPYRKLSASVINSWFDYSSFDCMAFSNAFVANYQEQIKTLYKNAKTKSASEIIGDISGNPIEMTRWANSNASLSSDVRPSSVISMMEELSKNKSIQEVIQKIEEMQKFSKEYSSTENVVAITTIHRSKGLEWPYVFIPGLGGELIPHKNNLNIEEERRLLYVAITRAIKGVALLRRANEEESFFADEISPHVKKVEIRHGNAERMGKTSG